MFIHLKCSFGFREDGGTGVMIAGRLEKGAREDSVILGIHDFLCLHKSEVAA